MIVPNTEEETHLISPYKHRLYLFFFGGGVKGPAAGGPAAAAATNLAMTSEVNKCDLVMPGMGGIKHLGPLVLGAQI